MHRILLAAPLLIAAGAAQAKIPFFNAVCGGVEVHADEGGPIFINGKEGKLTVFNDTA